MLVEARCALVTRHELCQAFLDLARGEAGGAVRDECVRQLVEDRLVQDGIERGREPSDRDPDAAVEGVEVAARPRGRAGGVVVALLGQQDHGDRLGRLVAEGLRQGGVVALQHTQHLASDILVRGPVVADVEVRERALAQADLARLVLLDPREQSGRRRVLATVEVARQDLDRLACAILAHERVGEHAGRLRIACRRGQDVARGALDGRPVGLVGADREQRAQGDLAAGRHDERQLEVGCRRKRSWRARRSCMAVRSRTACRMAPACCG